MAAARRVQPHLAALALTAIDPERDPSGETVQMGMELLLAILRE
jgi:hypothetical protein